VPVEERLELGPGWLVDGVLGGRRRVERHERSISRTAARKPTRAHRHERAFTLPGENAARQISLFSPAQLVAAEHA
jgi:hypothetical protein